MAFKQILAVFILSISALFVQSQCVVINEILANAAGACDGNCTPSTGEWFELYNTCTSDVDISCYVITDGDFAVTFPVGTFIEANGFLVIGSINSGVAIDIDLGSCGCTSGGSNQIGIFTNSNEQLALVNATGEFQDGVYWGTGQFSATPSFTTDPIGTCGSLTIPLSQSNPIFVGVAAQSNNEGFTINRACDGGNWQSGGQAPTPGESNGGSAAAVDFSASSTSICAGECINYINETVGNGTWTWAFEGSDTGASAEQSPSTICYPSEGTYDVTLTVEGSCGTSSLTLDNYIVVSPSLNPTVIAGGSTNLCDNESTTLQANITENIQWYNLNGPISGATGSALNVVNQGSYFFVATAGNCQFYSDSISVVIVETANVTISISEDAILCPGETVILSAPEGFEAYNWFNNKMELLSTESSIEVSNADFYTVQATLGECSATSAPVSISTVSNPEATISTSFTGIACPDQVISIEANDNMSTYAWFNDGSDDVISNMASIEITNSGDYFVVITDENGCIDSSEVVTLNYETPLNLILASDLTVFCEGNQAQLNVTGSAEISGFTWYDNNLTIPGNTSNSYTSTSEGIYYVELTTANGCTYTSNELELIVLPIPIVSVSVPSSVTTCENSLSVEGLTTASSGGIWTWYDINGSAIAFSNPTNFTSSGTYYSVYTDPNSCVGESGVFTLTLLDTPSISIIADDSTPCEGDTATLLVENNGGEILWNTGESSQTIETNSSGTFSVEVTFDNGCMASEQITIDIQPLPLVSAGSDVTAICGIGTILDGAAEGTYSWSPTTDLDDPTSINPHANPLDDVYYTLTATLNGCTSSASVLVRVDCVVIKIPNVFTPNNDDVNDKFEILTSHIDSYHIEIYNRWGDLVFTSDDEDSHWDGKIKGNDAEGGTYYYLLQITDSEGKSLIDKGLERGSLTLLR
jgi:gliding motility-associated-like protein